MANDINKEDPHYKGEYGSIYEVNRKFPTGGVAGDFVVIEGWAHYWNADRGTWCVNAERDSYWDELITNIIEKFKLVRGATYMGVASLDTVPTKAIGAKMYYFATIAGTYKNFGNLVVPQGINVLYSENGSSWVNTTLLEVAQELGVSTNKVVSQKTLNDALAKKFDKESVVQESGEAEDKVMSQKAVSDKLSDLGSKSDNSSADLNIGDPNGNVIAQFKGGHIKTQNFDSEKALSEKDIEDKVSLSKDNSSADLNIGDPNGNVIAQFKGGHIKTQNFDSRDFKNLNNGMTETSYEGAKLSIKKNRLFFKVLDGMPSSYNGSAQAAGIFNNYIVRLYDGGWCTICKLNEDDSVTLLQKFALKTQGFTKNHAGAGGFDFVKHDGDDFPYMVYGNSTLPIWYVENIHLNGTSELLQTINVTNVGPEGRWYNVHPTEDGYYLFFNIDKATGKNVFIAKIRKPSLSEGSEVTLTENDVVDSFTIHLDKFIEMQDGCVYDGKLWFAFSSGNGGDIKIFDLNSHKMTHTIPINMIPNELEDLCIYNDYLWVFYNGTSKYLKIKFD